MGGRGGGGRSHPEPPEFPAAPSSSYASVGVDHHGARGQAAHRDPGSLHFNEVLHPLTIISFHHLLVLMSMISSNYPLVF